MFKCNSSSIDDPFSFAICPIHVVRVREIVSWSVPSVQNIVKYFARFFYRMELAYKKYLVY
jgi:hypothetical protein